MKVRRNRVFWTTASILLSRAAADLPYNPASAFLPPNSADGPVYAFLPTSGSAAAFELVSLNISSTVPSSSLPYTTLSSSLPFIDGGNSTAFTTAMDEAGSLLVYAGSCAMGSAGSNVWVYNTSKANGKENWTKRDVAAGSSISTSGMSGANYLSSGIAFSSDGSSLDTTFYVFGGMCPTTATAGSTWTAAANYSNNMLSLAPPPQPAGSYDLEILGSRGPPIAEAGFTITGLQPTFTNATGAEQSRQQNFVLLGGHTQNAFINMSQVALFSLPEQTWSFIGIDSPDVPKSGLSRRSSATIDSRSGHSAVLTSDGKKIIVFGGWVGDITTAASPQLLVLNLGIGYGGTGDWAWSIPEQTGTGLPSGTGIYGHAAVMLPGGVMMVTSGYGIPTSNDKTKRAGSSPSSTTYFLNTTSNTWLPHYTNPSSLAPPPSTPEQAPQTGLSSSSKRAALASGISLGLLALIAACLVGVWYSRRLHARRDARERDLRSLALDAAGLHPSEFGLGGIHGRGMSGGAAAGFPRDGSQAPEMSERGFGATWRSETGVSEAERTGLLVEIPSPTRGLRRSLHARSSARSGDRDRALGAGGYQYQPYEEQRRSTTSGHIHPIDERDEYEDLGVGASHHHVSGIGQRDIVASAPVLDPFVDPNPLRSHPVSAEESPTSALPLAATTTTMATEQQDRAREIAEWVTDWRAADAALNSHLVNTNASHADSRAVSPEKDRTSSTLSEEGGSAVSAISGGATAQLGSLSRSLSQRSAQLFSSISNPFSGINPFSSSASSTSPTAFEPPSGLILTSPAALAAGAARNTTPSPTHQTHHQRPDSQSSSSFITAASSFHRLQTEGEALLPRPATATPPGSPTRRSRAAGWVGSVRRAIPRFSAGSRSPSPPSEAGSAASVRVAREAEVVRVTHGAGSVAPPGLGPGWREGRSVNAGDGEDYDIEAAMAGRGVQVMFSVPRERLRVVNPGDDRASDCGTEVEEYENEGIGGVRRQRRSADGGSVGGGDGESVGGEVGSLAEESELGEPPLPLTERRGVRMEVD